MDILEELPVQQWPCLQNKLRALWPLNLPAYYTLHINLKCPKVREAFKFKVYCPYGNMDNGFIAFTMKCLLQFDYLMQFDNFEAGTAKMYHLAPTKPFMDLKPPENTYLTSVIPQYIHRVNDTWPYKYSYSYTYFNTLAANGLSYGLYSTDTDELLAWIFINEYNYLCHLYCEEQHRKRGYAEYITKRVINDILKDGHDVYAYVVPSNKRSLGLFAKLGFIAVDEAAFINMEKPAVIYSHENK